MLAEKQSFSQGQEELFWFQGKLKTLQVQKEIFLNNILSYRNKVDVRSCLEQAWMLYWLNDVPRSPSFKHDIIYFHSYNTKIHVTKFGVFVPVSEHILLKESCTWIKHQAHNSAETVHSKYSILLQSTSQDLSGIYEKNKTKQQNTRSLSKPKSPLVRKKKTPKTTKNPSHTNHRLEEDFTIVSLTATKKKLSLEATGRNADYEKCKKLLASIALNEKSHSCVGLTINFSIFIFLVNFSITVEIKTMGSNQLEPSWRILIGHHHAILGQF